MIGIAVLLFLGVASFAHRAETVIWNLESRLDDEWFLTATHQRKATVGSEHVLLEK